jgi:Cu/Ag efflux pump CusA
MLRQPSLATLVTVAFVAVGLVAIAAVPQLRASLVPSFNETALLVELEAAPGTSRPAMVRLTSEIGRELRAVDGVRNIAAHMGRAVMSDSTSGMNSSVLWVSIDPDADRDATVAEVRRIVDDYPGIEHRVGTYSHEVIEAVASVDDGAAAAAGRDGVLDVLTGAGEPVAVRIYGKDLGELRRQATMVRNAIADIDGVVDPRIDVPVNAPTIEIEANLAAAERYGIKPGDIRRAAATLVQGIEVGSLFQDQKVFEVLVVGEPGIRRNLNDIRNLLIDTVDGRQVRLSEVAHVRLAPRPSVIRREAASRHLDVTAGVSGRDVGGVLEDVERRLSDLSFPLEYRAELLHNSRERDAAKMRLLTFGATALIALFLLLQAAFSSWRLAAIVSAGLPLALSGSILALLATGNDFSIGALAGLLAVLGLSARQAVLLVDRYRRLEIDERLERAEMIAAGARERFLPVVASAAAIIALFLPVLVLRDAAGLELIYPMALSVTGGVITSSLLTLFLLPALYFRFAPGVEREHAEVRVAQPAS